MKKKRISLWSPSDFANGINAALGSNYYIHWRPSNKTSLAAAVYTDIVDNHPLGINFQETATKHYNYHPYGKRGHWLAVYAFSSTGATLWIDDPAANSPALNWPNVQQKFSMSAETAMEFLPAPYGIAY